MKKSPEQNRFYSKRLCQGSSNFIVITILLTIIIAIGVFILFGGTTVHKENYTSAYKATSNDATEEELQPTSTSNSGSKLLPALHVVLTWESIMIGENWERKNYRAKLDACQGSGMPTRALSSEDEAKLGTGEVEILIDARRQFARQTRWTLGADDGGAETTCLIKLEAHVDQSANEDDTGMYEAIDSDSRIQERQNLQSIGWKLIGEEQIKGQSCTRWQNDRQSVCMWSGGMKWGFVESPSDAAGCTVDGAGTYLNAIPLEAEPPKGGSGCRMQVKSFSLGKGLLPSKERSE